MTSSNKCKAIIQDNGETLECCRSDPNHEKRGLWHRKGRTYW